MKRVTGIGGIFFKSQDPEALEAWYRRHLGIDVQAWGGAVFRWAEGQPPAGDGMTVWSVQKAEPATFEPGSAPYMVNYRVDDRHQLLATLRAEGVTVEDRVESSEFGQFGWVLDPEGRRIELWQPPVAA